MSNFLSINPSTGSTISKITKEVNKALNRPADISLQIQFKYAQFKYFSPIAEQFYRRLPQQHERFSSNFIEGQRYVHLESLKRLSYQSMVLLNQLGRIYKIESQFEKNQNKFYWIRDFLIKLAKECTNPSPSPQNFFKNIIKSNNAYFQVTQNDELRLDIIIKQGQLNGRYSYTQSQGWVKVKKELLIRQQLDIMMSEKLFRLAINDQHTSEVHTKQLLKIKQFIDNPKNNGKYMIRLKRALRVQKNKEVQFSLSEVYEPKEPGLQLPELSQIIIEEPTQLDAYLFKSFQKFYATTTEISQTKLEVQSQFTKNGVQILRKIAGQCQQRKNFAELQRKIQLCLQDLYALSYCEHRQKVEQKQWFQIMSKQKIQNVEGRLENQFGSYMRDLIYNQMTYAEE